MTKYMNKFGGPMTAFELWTRANVPTPFIEWKPAAEMQDHLDRYFGERRNFTFVPDHQMGPLALAA